VAIGVVFGRRDRGSQGVQAALSVTDEEAVEMPAGDPELGRSRGDRQLLRNDLENSTTRSGHARDCPPTPGQAASGGRRSGTRSARASTTTAGTLLNPATV
jgi:hypothetical protein